MNLFVVVASIVIVVIAVVILLFLGFKFPRGRADWPYDRSETTRYVIMGILFLMILGLTLLALKLTAKHIYYGGEGQ